MVQYCPSLLCFPSKSNTAVFLLFPGKQTNKTNSQLVLRVNVQSNSGWHPYPSFPFSLLFFSGKFWIGVLELSSFLCFSSGSYGYQFLFVHFRPSWVSSFTIKIWSWWLAWGLCGFDSWIFGAARHLQIGEAESGFSWSFLGRFRLGIEIAIELWGSCSKSVRWFFG